MRQTATTTSKRKGRLNRSLRWGLAGAAILALIWAAAYSYDAFVAVLIIAAVAGVIIKQRLFPSDRS